MAVAVAIGLTVIFGVGLERLAYRPLRDSPRISIMISAIGASFLIENLAIVLFDARPKAFPVPEFFARNFVFSGVPVSYTHLDVYKRQALPMRTRAPIGGGIHKSG